jgi:hypothetical protein
MNFQCPYCNQHTTIVGSNSFSKWEQVLIRESKLGEVGYLLFAITCPNPKCNQLYLSISLTSVEKSVYVKQGSILQTWHLLPESRAKVLPTYIPKTIQEDYYEACRIRDLSPKASATLARRCLQSMIRDFWGIKKTRLIDEIRELEQKVDPLTWSAIDSVREVGNIGAHMEKDINLIIEVEPKEAQILIELIEQLVDDWYVERFNKEQRSKKIKELATVKKELKK